MLIRERTEELEKKLLSPKAAFPRTQKEAGRKRKIPCARNFSATGTVFSTVILSAG